MEGLISQRGLYIFVKGFRRAYIPGKFTHLCKGL